MRYRAKAVCAPKNFDIEGGGREDTCLYEAASKPHGKDQLWQEAKQKCRLNDDDIAIAKRMNISPKSLIKNIPSKSEPWKAPVKDWLRSLDEKARDKAEKKAKRKATVMRAKEQVPETQSAPKDSDAAKKNGK